VFVPSLSWQKQIVLSAITIKWRIKGVSFPYRVAVACRLPGASLALHAHCEGLCRLAGREI
jgi:hypothetical protein